MWRNDSFDFMSTYCVIEMSTEVEQSLRIASLKL